MKEKEQNPLERKLGEQSFKNAAKAIMKKESEED